MEQDVNQIGEFHKNHGAYIVLLEEGRVAYIKKSDACGVVFTKYPIGIGGLFEVKVEEIDQQYYHYGLVSTNTCILLHTYTS